MTSGSNSARRHNFNLRDLEERAETEREKRKREKEVVVMVESASTRAFIRLSPNEEEADRVRRLRASAKQRVVQARQAANVRGRATSRAARARGQAEEGARNVLMLEESQSERKDALLKMQGALEALREEMGEAHARSSMQRALTARAREEDAIRATVRQSRAALRYKLAELTVRSIPFVYFVSRCSCDYVCGGERVA